MNIRINGSEHKVPKGITLQELVDLFKVNRNSVVLELNREIVERKSFSATQLKEADTVEIVHFVGGG